MKKGLVGKLDATYSATVADGSYSAGDVFIENADGTWAKGAAVATKRAAVILEDHATTDNGNKVVLGTGVFNKHMVGVTDPAQLAILQEKGINLTEGQA